MATDNDPFATQRVSNAELASELASEGFSDVLEIGRGGFGVVYRCMQTVLERTVAVKVLTADFDNENRERFLREQRAMGRLTGHPNIVNVLQVGATDSGRPFLVMPYYARGCLDTQIRRRGPLPLDEVLRLGVKIAGALETAHRLGIIHRDVKPSNILLSDYDEPALTDFGIARMHGGFETATGTITGSPAFTAPEVLDGKSSSPASDVYGLGATLFCALTGHAAFERRSGEQLVAQFVRITTQPVPDLREHDIADDMSTVVERAMAASAPDRPSAAALGEDLQRTQLHHGLSVDDMALQAGPGRKRRSDPVSKSVVARSGGSSSSAGPYPRPGTSTGNLPVELTSFVGRRHELSEVKRWLGISHLVTLTGFGGVGKTRLALRAADSVRRGFTDGVWLVEFAELSDGSLLVDLVAAALGLRHHQVGDLSESLLDFLARRELLLVFDNCEQVVDAAAELSATLLRSCPRLRILATSREPLGIEGETVLSVPPLAVPAPDRRPSLRGTPSYDAVTLFSERAAAAVPTFALTEDNGGTVAQICHRLDGLPLPIELAAARLRALSPEQILQRLADRFTLLTRGSRNAPTRQQTMRLCVDWSFELCTSAEQLVWARLSVFAGSVELDAAEQICGSDMDAQEVLDSLTSLVDKSILIREEAGTVVRFRLLDILRDYGREKAHVDEGYTELRCRHRDWYRQLALAAEAEWISSRQLDWIARLDREQTNFRESMEFCLSDDASVGLTIAAALEPFWRARGLFSEGRRWLDRLLAQPWQTPTVDRVKALHAHSVLAELQGDLTAAAGSVTEGRRVAQQLTDSTADAFVALGEGTLALYRGDFAHARSLLETALEGFGAHDPSRIEVLHMLGRACDQAGDGHRAIEYYSQALAITEACSEVVHRAPTLRALGIAAWRQSDRPRTVRLLEQALQLSRQVGDRRTTATCLEVLAWVAAEDNDARRAAVLMGAAEDLVRSVGTFTLWFQNLLNYHDECERRTIQALGERTYASSRGEGQGLGLDAAIAYALGEKAPTPQPAAGETAKLTKRERQIAEAVAEGLTNRAIATRLVISPRTVQGHVEHILSKLGFNTRAQIAAWVVEQTSA
ncbi:MULTISPECIES: protein kinase domain-containing protein [unclassified Rhodococcus (in: high G+C Gram-positive bacteria)]|uniref:protein kinase domain-containing protein n=1 Tax=unclassified Rhodococcus (in: high G+C Gram-positive bacteria) TaxID=192944 RepID=UPI00163B02B8|nr:MULTISPECIES: protein kinase [unclassified Rhodococcus (in: high G+C Gram-positive bacteria)]MBC2637805.1 protein kinase [Rhodococcus sp. 3A]MBC2897449.1 protein kinase [Rhodococcus sp. 4CII]